MSVRYVENQGARSTGGLWPVSDDYELADAELIAAALEVGPACIDP